MRVFAPSSFCFPQRSFMSPKPGAAAGVKGSAAEHSLGAPITYQLDHVAACRLPTPWAEFQLHAFIDPATGKEHLAIALGDLSTNAPVLARVHSECLTGDGLFSQRCDCGAQLETSLRRIAEEGRGLLLYLRQEGRGIEIGRAHV